jgi:sugar/nucleoside kinase (ribokinase family)
MFDITFIGHMCYDEIVHAGGQPAVAPGSAVLCGALGAARVGKSVAVITRMSPLDMGTIKPMEAIGISTFVIPADATTYMRVVYPGADVDQREITQVRSAGFFSRSDMPELRSRFVHLAGITDQEFTMDFVRDLQSDEYELSLDVQSFLRQVDSATGRITISNVPEVRDIFPCCARIKLDIVEARLLTGVSGIRDAARILAGWGCRELVITEAKGVLAIVDGVICYERFNNRTMIGRTGRGDTTFAAYLSWRLEHEVPESLQFAAAVASIKMEAPGPFAGTLQDALARMRNIPAEDGGESR